MPVLVIIVVLGAALRFYGLGHQGIWYDEAYTFQLLHLSYGAMLGRIPHQESTPPLYYTVAWLWARIFGFGAAGVRSLSAVCSVGLIPVMYGAARKLLHGRRAALIVAALTAFNPLLIWYAQEARAYSMMLALCGCSLLAFAYARERPRPLALALWAAASAMALATHYYAALLVLPEALWLLYEHRYRRPAWAACGFVAAVGLALVPLAAEQANNAGNAWIGKSSLGERLTQVVPLFLIGPETVLRTALKFIAFVLLAAAFALLALRSRRRERQGALLVGGLALVGFVVSLLVIPVNDSFLTRNLMELWLPLALLVAAGLGVARAPVLGLVLTAGFCVIGATAAISVASDYDLQRPNWLPVADLIGTSPAHGSRLVLIQRNPGMPLALFLPGLTYPHTRAVPDVTEVDVIAVQDIRHLGGFCWWGSACNLSPSKLQWRYALRGFHVVLRAHVEQFSVLKLVSERPETVSRRALSRALHTTRLTDDTLLTQPS